VADGDVEILFVGRHRDPVRPVDIHGHQPDTHLAFNVSAARAKPNQYNLVRGFANHIDKVVLCRMLCGRRGRRLRPAAETERQENQQTRSELKQAWQ